MTKIIYLETDRTKSGTARAEVSRYVSYSNNKVVYAFKFYKTFKTFRTYQDLKNYIESNYKIINVAWWKSSDKYATLPATRQELFN